VAKKILFKNISVDNYLEFRRCSISEDGEKLTCQYANGATYDVPMEYYLQWHDEPHYVVKDGRSEDWPEGKEFKKRRKKVKFVRCRRVMGGRCIRVYLSDNTACDVPWDTVLMTCEKNYEEFGGLTERSKKIIYGWHKQK
jgi:hypothetical protein